MAAKDPTAPYGRTRDGKPRRKSGPPKGVRPGGRGKGTRNKAVVEREKTATLAAERARMREEADKVGGAAGEMIAAQAAGKTLMKEIGFALTQLCAGLATYYAPAIIRDALSGRDVVSPHANPNFDEKRFDKYLGFAMAGARDFASYESPKLSAVMLAADIVTEIEVVGGLPDDQDGGFVDAPAEFAGVTIDAIAEELKPGASGAGAAGARTPQSPDSGPVSP